MNKLSTILLVLLTVATFDASAQRSWTHKKKFGTQKNTMYFYWGYNRSAYTRSKINFYGPEYNFTAFGVKAEDRPERDIATYFNPTKITVPQFNIRLGWYYKFRWDWSIGYDHMKYVMKKDQSYTLNGVIDGVHTYNSLNGTFTNATGIVPININELHYENTNGLNYISVQLHNTAPIYKTQNLKFAIQRRLGGGAGVILTQTDFNWDYQTYHSQMKFGGYGISAHAGLRFDFWNRVFAQSSLSTGFMHLPKNATIQNIDPGQRHYASHHFFFIQWDVVVGLLWYVRTKNQCDSCPDWH